MKIRPTHKQSTTTHLKFALLSFSFCRAVNPQLSSPHTATRCLSAVNKRIALVELKTLVANKYYSCCAAANIFYSSSLLLLFWPSLLVCSRVRCQQMLFVLRRRKYILFLFLLSSVRLSSSLTRQSSEWNVFVWLAKFKFWQRRREKINGLLSPATRANAINSFTNP